MLSLIDATVVGSVVGSGAVTALLPTMRHSSILLLVRGAAVEEMARIQLVCNVYVEYEACGVHVLTRFF